MNLKAGRKKMASGEEKNISLQDDTWDMYQKWKHVIFIPLKLFGNN